MDIDLTTKLIGGTDFVGCHYRCDFGKRIGCAKAAQNLPLLFALRIAQGHAHQKAI